MNDSERDSLLIEMHGDVRSIKTSLDMVFTTLGDHETRLRAGEGFRLRFPPLTFFSVMATLVATSVSIFIAVTH